MISSMNCPACGAALAGNSRFCSACGRAIDADTNITRTVAMSVSSSSPSSSRTSSDGRFLPGVTLAARYRIIALLGRGGMGEVYRADDLTLGQPVALKFLPPEVAANPVSLERFRNEVRIARRVSHPNVCRVYDVGEVDGNYFLSMEYVDGEDLGSLLRRIGRIPEDKALEISRRLCAGLAAAHEKGVLHRDLKPANIMLDGRGQVLLSDFGLAGFADQMQGAEIRNGTPAYMAPEQLAGKEVTVKSDIYSLGLVIYETITGKRAFESDTLAGLERARAEGTLTNPSTLVKDLDPRIERVVLRCLEPDPANRPASALAVAAALPGGDPLGEALAAGDTPSPEMVAAAGEGIGLQARTALIVLAATVAGLIFQAGLAQHLSALEHMRLDYSPEVLAQKARDTIAHLGFPDRPADEWYDIDFDAEFLNYVELNEKAPHWNEVLQSRPSALLMHYRQSPYPMSAERFHTDALTPGVVTYSDPPVEMSGMINVALDAQGRLQRFLAVPPQVLDPRVKTAPAQAPDAKPPDWKPFFAAAELDPTAFQPADPKWTFVASSDLRQAWTGVWPGSNRPLRIEAASLDGKPVVFQLLSPWNSPGRMPPRDSNSRSEISVWITATVALTMLAAAAFLARRNIRAGRGDRRSAFRLASLIFFVQMALWIFREHYAPTLGTLADFLVAIATSLFGGAALWMIYIAVEPYARRLWPHAMISWTAALNGRIRDPIVGRDILLGIAFAAAALIGDRFTDLWSQAHGSGMNFGNVAFLMGFRSSLGVLLAEIPAAIRTALLFFLMLLIFRAILRSQWLAGAAFAAIMTSTIFFQSRASVVVSQTIEGALLYSMIAICATRFGLVTLVVSFITLDIVDQLQVTTNASAWYFGIGVSVLAAFVALAVWSFRISIGSQRLIADDF
jgi:hypothetical protein